MIENHRKEKILQKLENKEKRFYTKQFDNDYKDE